MARLIPSTVNPSPLNQPLDELLTRRNLVSAEDLAQARRLQAETGGRLDQALLRYGAISEDNLLALRAEQLGLRLITEVPETHEPYLEALGALGLDGDWFADRQAAPWMAEGSLIIAMRDAADFNLRETVDQRAMIASVTVEYALISGALLDAATAYIQTRSLDDDALGMDAQRLRDMAEEAPVIEFVNRVFAYALKNRASDIHIEPFEDRFVVRYRIDGVLRNGQTESRAKFDAVVSRVKLLSKMDIAERRLPQDGRQTIRFAGADVDLRVSSLPGSWGESLVMRLLQKDKSLPDLNTLGLEGRSADLLGRLISHPNGVVLVTGPTGSGKSTTLYKALQELNNGFRKIITIEDPVEYDMDGVVQIPINAAIGYTFAKGLRAILRQDPDIIMVGEIRDGETAVIAAQAALTGHLVLSTLHTNSALAGVARLIDVGLDPYMVASAVRGFAAQRLVRRLCEACSAPETNSKAEAEIRALKKDGVPFPADIKAAPTYRRAVGCAACDGTGYHGRVALFEVAEVDENMASAIFEGSNLQQLVRIARNAGFLSLYEDGLIKARRGLTSLSEVKRVCGGDVATELG